MTSVLVIDDDALIREMARDMLSERGCHVDSASSAAAGLAALEKSDYDVVLLDIVMPDRHGPDILPDIHRIREDTVVIIVTAFASMETAIEAIKKGAYDYIKKPLHPDELYNAVARAMERHELIKKNEELVVSLSSKVEGLELVEKVSVTLSSTLDLDVLLERVMELTGDVIGAEGCSILLQEEESGEFVFSAATGEKREKLRNVKMDTGRGIAGWVFANGEALLVEDVTKDERFYGAVDDQTGFVTRSIIAVPLLLKGRVMGVLEVVNKKGGGFFDDRDLSVLTTMASQIAITTENARITEQLRSSNEQIENYSRNLEGMVRRRTEDLERANRELKDAHAQLLQAEKLASLGQLAAGVAHEINNPVGFISSNLTMLDKYTTRLLDLIKLYERALRNPGKKAEAVSFRGKIDFVNLRKNLIDVIHESQEGTERILRIVTDLKLFSRADVGERVLTDMNALLDSTLNVIRNEIKHKAKVVKKYGNIPKVECFMGQIGQLFMNLLVNASQAIDGKGVITVETGTTEAGTTEAGSGGTGEGVYIKVSDTGTGIAPEHLGKLFDPFFTTKEPGKGTGLGLSVGYTIVQTHNGTITVESVPGKGTTFTVSLPRSMALGEKKAST